MSGPDEGEKIAVDNVSFNELIWIELYWNLAYLRATLCKILISTFAHKMDFAHNFSVDFF